MKRRIGILVAAVGALLAPVAFGATTVKKLTVAELAEASDRIIQGTVLGNEVVFEEGTNGPRNVRTLTTIQVSRTFKGEIEETVTVVGYGGVVGNVSYNWPGVPRFKLGGEAILFLTKQPSGGLRRVSAPVDQPQPQSLDLLVTSLEQGRLAIVEKPGVGKVVTQSFEGLQFQGAANANQPPKPKKLAHVVTEIESIVEAQRQKAENGGAK